MEVEQ